MTKQNGASKVTFVPAYAISIEDSEGNVTRRYLPVSTFEGMDEDTIRTSAYTILSDHMTDGSAYGMLCCVIVNSQEPDGYALGRTLAAING